LHLAELFFLPGGYILDLVVPSMTGLFQAVHDSLQL